MKRTVSFLLILVCTVTLSGCINAHSNIDEPPKGSTELLSTAPVLSTEAVGTPSEGEEKQLLELKHFTDFDLNIDSAKGIEIQSKKVSIQYNTIVETDWVSVSSATSLEDIVETIQADYPGISFDNWEYNVHLIADNGSWGMIRLRYRISTDISTNKAIMCSYKDGYIDEIVYTNMCFTLTDDEEQEIIRRTDDFLKTHIQEKKVLQENERFLEEQTTITYYYNIDKLVYTHALFFEYGDGDITLINNDYGSEYVIE